MSSTTNPPETEVQKIELDAKALLTKVEEFFKHLIEHSALETHEAIKAAQAITAAITPVIVPSPAPEPVPTEAEAAETTPQNPV